MRKYGVVTRMLTPFTFLGFESILVGNKKMANYVATESSLLLNFGPSFLSKLILPTQVREKQNQLQILERILPTKEKNKIGDNILQMMIPYRVSNSIANLQAKNYKKGEIVLKKGQILKEAIVVLEGEIEAVEVLDFYYIQELKSKYKKGQIFGARESIDIDVQKNISGEKEGLNRKSRVFELAMHIMKSNFFHKKNQQQKHFKEILSLFCINQNVIYGDYGFCEVQQAPHSLICSSKTSKIYKIPFQDLAIYLPQYHLKSLISKSESNLLHYENALYKKLELFLEGLLNRSKEIEDRTPFLRSPSRYSNNSHLAHSYCTKYKNEFPKKPTKPPNLQKASSSHLSSKVKLQLSGWKNRKNVRRKGLLNMANRKKRRFKVAKNSYNENMTNSIVVVKRFGANKSIPKFVSLFNPPPSNSSIQQRNVTQNFKYQDANRVLNHKPYFTCFTSSFTERTDLKNKEIQRCRLKGKKGNRNLSNFLTVKTTESKNSKNIDLPQKKYSTKFEILKQKNRFSSPNPSHRKFISQVKYSKTPKLNFSRLTTKTTNIDTKRKNNEDVEQEKGYRLFSNSNSKESKLVKIGIKENSKGAQDRIKKDSRQISIFERADGGPERLEACNYGGGGNPLHQIFGSKCSSPSPLIRRRRRKHPARQRKASEQNSSHRDTSMLRKRSNVTSMDRSNRKFAGSFERQRRTPSQENIELDLFKAAKVSSLNWLAK